MKRAAAVAGVTALAWSAPGALAAVPSSGVPIASVASVASAGSAASVPMLVPQHILLSSRKLRPRTELAARRAGRARQRAWGRAFRSARTYARGRLGQVSFAVVDDAGRVRSFRGHRTFYSASLMKAMLLVAYLRRPEVRRRALTRADRAFLGPMIRRSDNRAATAIRTIVGNSGLARLARRTGMRWFAPAVSWGNTHLAAVDQAAFFYGIDRLVPARHRAYARGLLSHVVAPQRWGIPEVVGGARGVRVFFKGGWRPSVGGFIVNQAALVEAAGGRRMSLAVMTDHDRTEGYGHETVRGVAARLVRGLASK